MVDRTAVKLGKLAPHPASRSKRMSFVSLMAPDLPMPAPKRDWTGGDKFRPMFGNDKVGDCTCASIANILISQLKAAYGERFAPTAADVISFYSAITGYDPDKTNYKTGDNPTDTGAVIEDVVNYVMAHGFMGHHVLGAAAIDPTNWTNICRAIDWFGNIDVGVNMPTGFQSGKLWAADMGKPGGWGGHCVSAQKYDEDRIYVWSWGELIPMTREAIVQYVDTVDVLFSAGWIKAGKSPDGIGIETLEANLPTISNA